MPGRSAMQFERRREIEIRRPVADHIFGVGGWTPEQKDWSEMAQIFIDRALRGGYTRARLMAEGGILDHADHYMRLAGLLPPDPDAWDPWR